MGAAAAIITAYDLQGRKYILNNIESITSPNRKGPNNFIFNIETVSGKVHEVSSNSEEDINSIFTALTSSWVVATGVVAATTTTTTKYATENISIADLQSAEATYYISPNGGGLTTSSARLTSEKAGKVAYINTYVYSNYAGCQTNISLAYKNGTLTSFNIPAGVSGSYTYASGDALQAGADYEFIMTFEGTRSGSISMSPILLHLEYEM